MEHITRDNIVTYVLLFNVHAPDQPRQRGDLISRDGQLAGELPIAHRRAGLISAPLPGYKHPAMDVMRVAIQATRSVKPGRQAQPVQVIE